MHRIFGSPEIRGSVNYWLDLLHPEDSARVGEHFLASLEGKHPYDLEYRINRHDGVRWVRSKGRVIGKPGEVQQMFGIIEDVTSRKLVEESLQQSQIALVQTEKLAAVGRLAASISHEINNPLEAVTNLLYLMNGSNDVNEIYEYVNTAERELRRVSIIANQTLRFYKQSSKPIPAFCYELIGETLSVYQSRLMNAGIEVQKRKRAEHPVQCFEGEIRQVLSNLIGNAIDSMPFGGRLLVGAAKEQTGRQEKRESF